MAKELPYFRFTASEWLNDDISLESYEAKGLFIDVCAYYWMQDCHVTLEKINKKFSNATILLEQLIKSDIIKHENKHDKVKIDFLDIQYDLLSEKRKARQSAGSKGGNAKAKKKQTSSYKDNNKDNNKELEKQFDLFWTKYPKKIAKPKCLKKFQSLSDEEISKILSTIDKFIQYKPFEDYTHPNPYTYLNNNRWDDEIREEEKPKYEPPTATF